jgi:Brp/Blh family beta-carotene 15,15'-monooxygenase
MTSWDLAAIGAIIFIGVPHGGLDGAVARRIGWPNGMMAWIGFNLSYVFLAALVAWAWLQWPLLGLSGFLIISALHFGASDIANTRSSIMEKSFLRWLPLISHGGLVSIAIPNFQASSVQSLFTLLVGNTGAAMLINTLSLFLLPWLLCVTAYLGYAFIYPVWRKPLLSLVLLLMLAWWLPPLISFAVYFCLCHSRNHLLRVWFSINKKRERRRSFIEAMVYSVLAWASVLVFLFIVPNTLTTALVQITFIGLAALTVPHMLLVDLANKLNK